MTDLLDQIHAQQQPQAQPQGDLLDQVHANNAGDPRYQLSGGVVTDPTAIDKLPDARYFKPGSFLGEAVETPLRQTAAGGYDTAAFMDRLGGNIMDMLDRASRIPWAPDLTKHGLLGQVRDWLYRREGAQRQAAEQMSEGRKDLASQIYRGVTGGILQLPVYAASTALLGPTGGMAALGAAQGEHEGAVGTLEGALEGALTGKALEVMGPASRPIRLMGAGLMAYLRARMAGADNTTALAHAVSLGGLTALHPGGMGVKDIARMDVQQGIDALGEGVMGAAGLAGKRIRSNLNPVEQRAIDDLRGEGVRMRAGTQTGNRFLQAAEGVTAATPLGSVRAGELQRGTEEDLQNLGAQRLEEISAYPASPESAAERTRGLLQRNIEGLQGLADTGYEQAWKGRNDPGYTYNMPVRAAQPLLDADGKPTGETIPAVMKPVNMPVDVTDVKQMAEPIRDELQWVLSRTEQSQSTAFGAIEKLLSGDDYIPAWMAERGLSALKSLSRTSNQTGVRNYGQGVAAGLVPKLQANIDAAVAATGDDAIAGLKQGRAKHAEMQDVVDVAERLRKEPVQAFNQMTQRQDTGVDYLRQVTKLAPEAAPYIARAWLQRQLDLLFREGGIQRTKEVLNGWRDLGDKTKDELFPDKNIRAKWDNFFKGVDLVPNKTNPSGTEITKQATSLSPLRWLAGYIGGRVLFTPRGIDLLTQGLGEPEGSLKARVIQNELKGMGGQDPPEPRPPIESFWK